MVMESDGTFEYQRTGRFFGLIADGMEELGEEELAALGTTDPQRAYRGLFFTADMAAVYRINYLSRFLTRVLAPLVTFDCHSDRYLYRTAMSLDWSQFLSVDSTFAVFATVSDSRIGHSQFAALRLKDAVADWFMEREGRRPNVDTENPDVWLGLRIHRNRATIRLDTSGGSLHRRGYRRESVEAPMQETLAAAIVHLSGWDGSTPMMDPMCGSGTLLCEALMRWCRIPAAFLRRKFGFQCMPEYDRTAWSEMRGLANSQIRELPEGLILGSDSSAESVDTARGNCSLLPSGGRIRIRTSRYQELGDLRGLTLITNPPYGLRLGRDTDMGAFMRELGDFLKQRCAGSTAYVYFGKRDLLKDIGLRASWRKPLRNGRLDGRLARFDLY
jgi:putative N6-adenine-specific DNA methylase